MNSPETAKLRHVGKVMDAHGIRGELYCLVFSGDISWLEKVAYLNLVKDGESFRIKILKLKPFKRGFIVSLEGFTTRNRAEEFKGAEVWAEDELFVSQDGELPYLVELLSFGVVDEVLGQIGKVKAFSSNGVQDLLIIDGGGEEFEIPFVKNFVVEMDFVNKRLVTRLPEGLLDINKPGYDED